jgi:hypothetical protein
MKSKRLTKPFIDGQHFKHESRGRGSNAMRESRGARMRKDSCGSTAGLNEAESNRKVVVPP